MSLAATKAASAQTGAVHVRILLASGNKNAETTDCVLLPLVGSSPLQAKVHVMSRIRLDS